jgi:hypothetical protein
MTRREHLSGAIIGFVVLVVAAALFFDISRARPLTHEWIFGILGGLGALMGVGSLVDYFKTSRIDPITHRPIEPAEWEDHERAVVEVSTEFPGGLSVPGQPIGYTHRLSCGHSIGSTLHHVGRAFCDDCYRAAERARLRSEGRGDAS